MTLSFLIISITALYRVSTGISDTHTHTHIYIYIYIIFKWRNWYYPRITMTRKSIKHLHVTYGALNSGFDLITSHQQCTPWSPLLEIEPTTTVCRSRNSTTGPSVHATYKRSRIISYSKLRVMCLEGYVFPLQRTRPPPGLCLPKSE